MPHLLTGDLRSRKDQVTQEQGKGIYYSGPGVFFCVTILPQILWPEELGERPWYDLMGRIRENYWTKPSLNGSDKQEMGQEWSWGNFQPGPATHILVYGLTTQALYFGEEKPKSVIWLFHPYNGNAIFQHRMLFCMVGGLATRPNLIFHWIYFLKYSIFVDSY